MRIRAKLDQQRDENQDDCDNKRHRQFAKARLLLLKKSAILDSHSRRQLHVLLQLRLDLANSRSEIISFKSTSHADHLPQVLALNLSLSFVDLHSGDLVQ